MEPAQNARPRRLPPSEVDCKWWRRGYCFRGDECYFRHDGALRGVDNASPSRRKDGLLRKDTGSTPAATDPPPQAHASSSVDPATNPEKCGICLELPIKYGLLLDCDHVFCLSCIRNWRSSNNDGTRSPYSETSSQPNPTKTCPMCRTPSDFVIPSSVFPSPPQPVTTTTTPENDATQNQATSKPHNPAKEKIVKEYLARLKNIPCRYFQAGVNRWRETLRRTPNVHQFDVPFRPVCYFANKCHYAHTCPVSGLPYVFSEQEIWAIERARARRRAPELTIPLDEIARREFDFMMSLAGMGDPDDMEMDDFDDLGGFMPIPMFFSIFQEEARRSGFMAFGSSDDEYDDEDEWEDYDDEDDDDDDDDDKDEDDSSSSLSSSSSSSLPDLIPANPDNNDEDSLPDLIPAAFDSNHDDGGDSQPDLVPVAFDSNHDDEGDFLPELIPVVFDSNSDDDEGDSVPGLIPPAFDSDNDEDDDDNSSLLDLIPGLV